MKTVRMYEAVPSSEPEVELDEEMEKFQNLLQDYLTGITTSTYPKAFYTEYI